MESILRSLLKHHLVKLPKLGQALLAILAFAVAASTWAADLKSDASSVQLENLTSTEVRDLIASGTTTIIIPIG